MWKSFFGGRQPKCVVRRGCREQMQSTVWLSPRQLSCHCWQTCTDASADIAPPNGQRNKRGIKTAFVLETCRPTQPVMTSRRRLLASGALTYSSPVNRRTSRLCLCVWGSKGETCASSGGFCSAPRSTVHLRISPSQVVHLLSDLPLCPFRTYRNVWTKCWRNLKVSGIRIHLDIYAERLQLKVKCQLFQSLRLSINNACLLVWSAVYGNEFHWAISAFFYIYSLD